MGMLEKASGPVRRLDEQADSVKRLGEGKRTLQPPKASLAASPQTRRGHWATGPPNRTKGWREVSEKHPRPPGILI